VYPKAKRHNETVTLNTGIAANAHHKEVFKAVQKIADQALYYAKQTGHDKVQQYQAHITPPLTSHDAVSPLRFCLIHCVISLLQRLAKR